jgi:hypothetical protein
MVFSARSQEGSRAFAPTSADENTNAALKTAILQMVMIMRLVSGSSWQFWFRPGDHRLDKISDGGGRGSGVLAGLPKSAGTVRKAGGASDALIPVAMLCPVQIPARGPSDTPAPGEWEQTMATSAIAPTFFTARPKAQLRWLD